MTDVSGAGRWGGGGARVVSCALKYRHSRSKARCSWMPFSVMK